MNGKEILADTNVLIYLLKGDDTINTLLRGKQLYVSFITELELIGFKNISQKEGKQINSLLADCSIIQMNDTIKHEYVRLRKKYPLKLADSIIVATALSLNLPLLTADKQLKAIKDLDLLVYYK